MSFEQARLPPLSGGLLRAAFLGLLAVIALVPLPLGSNRPWAWFALSVGVGILLLVWAAGAGLARNDGRDIWLPAQLRFPAVLFLGVCLWATVQYVPWTPGTWHHPLWQPAGEVLGEPLVGRISVSPYRTLTALARLLSYGGVFFLALQLCRDPGRARTALRWMAAVGSAYAAYGLVVHFSGAETILWLDKWAYRGVVTSTFVNRNSYATYAGLTLVCACALLLRSLAGPLRTHDSLRQRTRVLLERQLGSGAPLVVAVLVIATALLLTGSRAGVFSSLLALLVLLASSLAVRAVSLRAAAGLSMALIAIGGAVVLLSGGAVVKRMVATPSDPNVGSRVAVYEVVAEAILERPVLGTGYGSFRDVFPMHRDSRVGSGGVWEQAHSTYLENALELGVPATVALCGALLGCAACCWGRLRRERGGHTYAAVGVATTVLVALHATLDFSLQIPAVAASYAFILGVACSQSARTPAPRASAAGALEPQGGAPGRQG